MPGFSGANPFKETNKTRGILSVLSGLIILDSLKVYSFFFFFINTMHKYEENRKIWMKREMDGKGERSLGLELY